LNPCRRRVASIFCANQICLRNFRLADAGHHGPLGPGGHRGSQPCVRRVTIEVILRYLLGICRTNVVDTNPAPQKTGPNWSSNLPIGFPECRSDTLCRLTDHGYLAPDGTGGISFSAIACPCFAAAGMFASASSKSVVANFGATAYTAVARSVFGDF
jgi:hypothetical protein